MNLDDGCLGTNPPMAGSPYRRRRPPCARAAARAMAEYKRSAASSLCRRRRPPDVRAPVRGATPGSMNRLFSDLCTNFWQEGFWQFLFGQIFGQI